MSLEGAIVEIIEYVDTRGFVARVCSSAAPQQVLSALHDAEDLLDEPDRLGPWTDDSQNIWRGLVIMDVASQPRCESSATPLPFAQIDAASIPGPFAAAVILESRDPPRRPAGSRPAPACPPDMP